MGDHAEIQGKVLGFLMGEWARRDNRQLISVSLIYAPGNGFRDEDLRKWVRADEPEFFAEFSNIEKLVMQIIEIAAGEADAKAPGKHRFIVRCKQHGGDQPSLSFALSPGYHGADDTAMVPSGGGGGGRDSRDQHVIASHAAQLMRVNQQMFDGTIRVLGQHNMSLHQQLSQLTAENATLRRELEEARSNQEERQFNIAMQMEKHARTKAGFEKLLQLGSVVMAKIGAGSGDNNPQGGTSPLATLIGEFYKSLNQNQIGTLMQLLDMSQKMMFMEIVNLVRPQEPQQGNQGAPAGTAGHANGAPPR